MGKIFLSYSKTLSEMWYDGKQSGKWQIFTQKGVILMLTSLIMPFVEYGNHDGYSMKRNFEPEPYVGQSAVVHYLKKCGRERGMSMHIPTDFFSGETITTVPNAFYTDEKYSWNGTLAYYVEKYNLKLPDEFIQHVLAQME